MAYEISLRSGLPADHVQKESVDAWDVIDVSDKTQAMIKWLFLKGLIPADIVFDITGGRTPMSVAAFSVVISIGIDVQYIRPIMTQLQSEPVRKRWIAIW